MPRILMLMACCALTLGILSACVTDEQPYQQYMRAYQQLEQEDSFELKNSGTLTTSEYILGAAEEGQTYFRMLYQVMRGESGAKCIADTSIKTAGEETVWVRQFFRDGYLYSQNISNPRENYRCPREDDFVMKLATEGIIEFPASVIARQSIEQTEAGLLLTFELEREKYSEYRYADAEVYAKSPLYTVLLDDEGRIKQINGHFQMGKEESGAVSWRTSYTITFQKYGGVELNFPELDDAEFPYLPI